MLMPYDLWGAQFVDRMTQITRETIRACTCWQLSVAQFWAGTMTGASVIARTYEHYGRELATTAGARLYTAADEYLRLFDLASPPREAPDDAAPPLSEAQRKAERLLKQSAAAREGMGVVERQSVPTKLAKKQMALQ